MSKTPPKYLLNISQIKSPVKSNGQGFVMVESIIYSVAECNANKVLPLSPP